MQTPIGAGNAITVIVIQYKAPDIPGFFIYRKY